MRILIALLLTCFCAAGQTIQYRNLNSTQLASNRFLVSIKGGVLLTNPVVSSGTITGSGSGLTNVTDAGALPKAGGVMSGGLGGVGITNTGPTYATGGMISTNGTAGVGVSNSPSGFTTVSGGTTNGGNIQAATLNTTGSPRFAGVSYFGSGANQIGANSTRIFDIASFSGFIETAHNNGAGGYVIEPTTTITGSANSAGMAYDTSNGGVKIIRVSAGTAAGLTNLTAGAITAGLTVTATNGYASYATHTPVALAVGASPFNFTNVAAVALECYFSGATAYAVDKNGVNVFGSLAGDAYFILQPGSRCAITYTVAPTMLTNSW